jgi:hypothetical protein
MKGLLCRVIGHQRTLVAFTSNRFSCRRCGADLGRDIPAMPRTPAASFPHSMQLPSNPAPRLPRERTRHMRLDTRLTGRPPAHPRRGDA